MYYADVLANFQVLGGKGAHAHGLSNCFDLIVRHRKSVAEADNIFNGWAVQDRNPLLRVESAEHVTGKTGASTDLIRSL